MTLKEKSSYRKMLALRRLTETGQYSAEYSLQLCEDYHDTGKLIDEHYEELAEWLESLLNTEEPEQEPTEEVEEENIEEVENGNN